MRLKVGARGAYEDVPRMPDGTPLIGDARNDENVAVNGIHAAFLRFHNKLLENGVARRSSRAPAGSSPGTGSGSCSTSSCR